MVVKIYHDIVINIILQTKTTFIVTVTDKSLHFTGKPLSQVVMLMVA